MKRTILMLSALFLMSSIAVFAGGQKAAGGGGVALDPNDGPLTPYKTPLTINQLLKLIFRRTAL